MDAFLVSLAAVALAECGDKTQLLCLCLAAQFRKPWHVIAGVAAATLLLNFVAAYAGVWLAEFMTPELLKIVLGVSLLIMAGVMLWPQKEEDELCGEVKGSSAFVASLLAFLLAEMGDKTQLASAALAAKFMEALPVVCGATLGMMLVNMPAVLLGHKIAHRLSLRWIKRGAAGLFAVLGVITLGLRFG